MSTAVKVLSSVIAFIICLVVILPFFISSDDILAQVSSQVEKQTGRSLFIDGEKKLSFFPALVLELNRVRFANLPQGSRKDMATMTSMQIHLPWMSIFSKQLNIEKFIIIEPDILLEVDDKGAANWQFIPANNSTSNPKASSPGQKSTADAIKPQHQSMSLPEGFDLQLGQIEIQNGTITYLDKQKNVSQQSIKLDRLNLAILLPSLHQALKINGEIRYAEQVFSLASTLSTPIEALNRQSFTLSIALTSALANFNYNGKITNLGEDIRGTLNLSGDSVKNIALWQKLPLEAQTQAFNQFSLTGNLHLNNNILRLNQLNASLDVLSVKGEADLHLTTPPYIRSDIHLGILNLTPYLPPKNKAAPEPDTEKSPPPSPAEKEAPSDEQAQPIVWDKTPIDLAALGAINADLKISSEQLKLNDITLGANQLNISLKDKRAAIALTQFNAYQGQGKGKIKLDASTTPYQLNTEFSLSGIQAQPLLRDVIGVEQLIGSGKLNFSFTSHGQSLNDFINQLNGSISTELSDGAIKGVNLAALARSAKNLLSGNFDKMSLDKDFSQSEKTDFAALNGNFQFAQGISTNNQLTLVNPFLRVSGQGKINLPESHLAYRLSTRLVNSAQGQAGTEKTSGLTLPVKIKGPFHQLKIKADLKSEASEQLKQKAKDKITDKLKDLFGN
ncbi:AsmA family protein [Thalassomonas sp. RHCl1]|uniref:AsmA family protein n=1 Tax=Thalassomonas sp. RHCl1 TaxID=2995320 RepID=UPI00248ACCC1|nr:AsmA family protein [Thalassomonas sp. RHCl1]